MLAVLIGCSPPSSEDSIEPDGGRDAGRKQTRSVDDSPAGETNDQSPAADAGIESSPTDTELSDDASSAEDASLPQADAASPAPQADSGSVPADSGPAAPVCYSPPNAFATNVAIGAATGDSTSVKISWTCSTSRMVYGHAYPNGCSVDPMPACAKWTEHGSFNGNLVRSGECGAAFALDAASLVDDRGPYTLCREPQQWDAGQNKCVQAGPVCAAPVPTGFTSQFFAAAMKYVSWARVSSSGTLYVTDVNVWPVPTDTYNPWGWGDVTTHECPQYYGVGLGATGSNVSSPFRNPTMLADAVTYPKVAGNCKLTVSPLP